MAGFAPIAEDNMSSEVINEEANLKQLSLEGEVYLKKKTSNPDNHKGTGGPGTWGISEMSGMTYINDVFNSDGSYAGWNANTNPSKITGTNGETPRLHRIFHGALCDEAAKENTGDLFAGGPFC